jgi:hypothetical protein
MLTPTVKPVLEMVPCPQCERPTPKARLALPISHGVCSECNRPTLRVSQADNAPMYETDAWSRGIRL